MREGHYILSDKMKDYCTFNICGLFGARRGHEAQVLFTAISNFVSRFTLVPIGLSLHAQYCIILQRIPRR